MSAYASTLSVAYVTQPHTYGGTAQLEVGYLTAATRVAMLLSRCENAADAVFSTPHSCLTTHVNLCPIRIHRLILGSIHSENVIIAIIAMPLCLTLSHIHTPASTRHHSRGSRWRLWPCLHAARGGCGSAMARLACCTCRTGGCNNYYITHPKY